LPVILLRSERGFTEFVIARGMFHPKKEQQMMMKKKKKKKKRRKTTNTSPMPSTRVSFTLPLFLWLL
jgi:hypothetical protein